MAFTTTYISAPAGSWAKVSDDIENVLITSIYSVPAHVHIASAGAPDANSAYHVCDSKHPFSQGGIAGADVYVRSGTDYALTLTMTKG